MWSWSAACYDDALAEAGEGGQSVGAALDHLDLVDDAFGVAVGGRLVEVGQQLLAPDSDALGEGVKGGDARALDRGEERVEALFGAAAVGCPVDGAERLLQSPRLGDQWLVGEQLDQASPVAFGEPFARFEQTVTGVVELGSPARVVTAAAGALRPPPPDGSLSLAANGVKRGVGAADEVEVVDDDPGVRQFGADCLPVGVIGVDRDDLDRARASSVESERK